ncbi:MAG TPA: hypothetical protein VFS24_18470, partial [Steroidobacteraceae bacterium]|nr:hypothetical protein [Steroidobacteraceae bacterium]
MSVYESGSSSFGKVLAGEDTVKDTPVGLPLDVEVGQAMDIWIEPRLVSERTIERPDEDSVQVEAQLEVRFANDKPVPVVIEYRQPLIEDLQVLRESKHHTMKDGDLLWRLRLKPGERDLLTYTVRMAKPRYE